MISAIIKKYRNKRAKLKRFSERGEKMNQEWSKLNKEMQMKLKKKETFFLGKECLFRLRNQLMEEMMLWKEMLSLDEFSLMPFKTAKGYHSKTIAYSLFHIFRIEDIVVHSLIQGDEQVFFSKDYQKRMNTPIITTGNELVGDQIFDFSQQLDLEELYAYILDVKNSTEKVICNLTFDESKRKVSSETRKKLEALHVVSEDENAIWLIDYWCGKDILGFMQMPLSRHWIMHVEACIRIKDKIVKERNKRIDANKI